MIIFCSGWSRCPWIESGKFRKDDSTDGVSLDVMFLLKRKRISVGNSEEDQ